MRNFITTFTMLILIQSAVFAGKKNKKKHSDPVQSIVEATRQLSVSTTSPTLLNQSAYALSASAIKDCRDFHKSLKNRTDIYPVWAVILSYYHESLEEILLKKLQECADDFRSNITFLSGLLSILPYPLELDTKYRDAYPPFVAPKDTITRAIANEGNLLEFLSSEGRVNILNWFFEQGASLLLTPGCETLRGAAFVAVFRGQVGVLDLFAQKDPNLLTFSAKRKGEWLKTAIEKNNQEVASWLVGKGFCFAQGDIDNYMALKLVLLEDASFLQRLSHASTSSTVSLIRFDTLDVDRVDHEGGNVWHCAAAVVKNAADLERMFTKLPTSSSFTKIHLQQSLIKKNLVDRFSPFHIAAAAGNVAFLQIISRKFRELALPNNQWLDDADNDNALTPLYSAVLANQVESVRELLRLGASTTMRAHFDITPLHAAASDGNLNIAKELTAYDPSLLRTTDKMGRRPIDVVMHEIIVREEEGKPIGQYRALYDCLAEEMKVASR